MAPKTLSLTRSLVAFGAAGRGPAFPPVSLEEPWWVSSLSGQRLAPEPSLEQPQLTASPSGPFGSWLTRPLPNALCGWHGGNAGLVGGVVLTALDLGQGGCCALCSLGHPPPRMVTALDTPSPQPALHFPGVTETFFWPRFPLGRPSPSRAYPLPGEANPGAFAGLMARHPRAARD